MPARTQSQNGSPNICLGEYPALHWKFLWLKLCVEENWYRVTVPVNSPYCIFGAISTFEGRKLNCLEKTRLSGESAKLSRVLNPT